jgi:hypothetical protein
VIMTTTMMDATPDSCTMVLILILPRQQWVLMIMPKKQTWMCYASAASERKRYPMGHVLQYGDCYMANGREYSPFLQTRNTKDYVVPTYLQPMKTFQIGLGTIHRLDSMHHHRTGFDTSS